MIKRRFYKLDHGDRDASDASSSSDSEIEAEPESTEEEESDNDDVAQVKQQDDDDVASTSSGYESEDSSANDVDVNSAGQLFSEEDAGTINERQVLISRELPCKTDDEKSDVLAEKESLPIDIPSHVLKCKSVFKCRICPRIICLSEDTLRDHLQSKRHARSEKLLCEGRLKAMLNSDGELENRGILEIQTEDAEDSAKKNYLGQKQHKKKLRKKRSDKANTRKRLSTNGPVKRRRKK
ncbi:hypothetical protein RJT34_18665 [Clitoria ternatea]|uniref:C2H2-type domain-containing protein n=1 Tax=Clitoria ternatea TaxID=43366 RepID=A0AAN9JDH7_CLITE